MEAGAPRRRRALLALALATLAVVATVLVVPAARAGAKAPGLLLEAFGAGVPRPLAPAVERREVRLDDVVGDLYDTGSDAPAVLLLPGAAEDGRADERVVRLARAVARSNRTVFVPELSLFAADLDLDDVDKVARATAALADRTARPVVVFGFSFGGSLGLVAAADPRVRDSVELVATFGSYADLVGVVQAATTGVSVVGRERLPWDVPDQAAEVVPEIAEAIVPPDERAAFADAVATGDPSRLSEEATAVHAFITNDDPDRTPLLASRLGQSAREVLAAYSPAAVADDLREVPVLAAHSRDDPAVPYAELLRVQRVLPHARTMTVQSFEHVDLDLEGSLWDTARDLRTSWSFVRRVLVTQERWPLLR
jgi:pimeloyl-ACP methyl ester carboxylesterase